MSQSAATNPDGSPDAARVVERLYEEYADRLNRYCRGQLRSAQEAEDAVQTTFVHAVQALQNGVVPECESAWLYTIAKNVCHSVRRANSLRLLHAVDVELDTLSTPEPERDLAEGLSTALAALPERQRQALVLREWHGLSSREVAGRLGMRTAETYALLTRARKAMASALDATTRSRTTVAVNLWSALSKLRSLLFGGVANSVTTATVAVAVAVGGTVAVERATSDPASARSRTGIVARATPSPAASDSRSITRPTSDGQVPLTAPAVSPTTRRHGPVRTSSPTSSTATGDEGDQTTPGTSDRTPTPKTTAAEQPTAAGESPSPNAVVSPKPQPEARVAGRRVRLPRVLTPVVEKVEKVVPPVDLPVDEPVDLPVDVPVPPEVTKVVDAVDDALEPLTGALPPLPSLLPPPPSSPPAPPKLLP